MNAVGRSKREGIEMSNDRRRFLVVVAFIGLAAGLAGCTAPSSAGTPTEPPVTVLEDEGTGLKTLSLSAKAAERLGIAMAAVTVSPSGGGLAVPYDAVLYDEHGDTWTYTSPGERLFVRASIAVDEIANGVAILSDGPPVGTAVVTVGTAELWGVESGVGGGH
jgi:hypothetical protein